MAGINSYTQRSMLSHCNFSGTQITRGHIHKTSNLKSNFYIGSIHMAKTVVTLKTKLEGEKKITRSIGIDY